MVYFQGVCTLDALTSIIICSQSLTTVEASIQLLQLSNLATIDSSAFLVSLPTTYEMLQLFHLRIGDWNSPRVSH